MMAFYAFHRSQLEVECKKKLDYPEEPYVNFTAQRQFRNQMVFTPLTRDTCSVIKRNATNARTSIRYVFLQLYVCVDVAAIQTGLEFNPSHPDMHSSIFFPSYLCKTQLPIAFLVIWIRKLFISLFCPEAVSKVKSLRTFFKTRFLRVDSISQKQHLLLSLRN